MSVTLLLPYLPLPSTNKPPDCRRPFASARLNTDWPDQRHDGPASPVDPQGRHVRPREQADQSVSSFPRASLPVGDLAAETPLLAGTNSGSSFSGLYSTTTNNPALGSSGGLKNAYRWGPLGQCGFVDGSNVVCDQPEFGQRFEPFNTLLADTPQQYKMACVLPPYRQLRIG